MADIARAFVTGGSGFIGGRLTEVLCRQFRVPVRTLVRTTTGAGGGAYRAAAAGAEIAFGSLTDAAAIAAAVAGCDVVFHCAYGSSGSLAEQRQVTVEGTRLLARAAAAAGVRHFVHLSTIVAYGGDTPPLVPEDYDSPKLWDWPYARDKLDAEHALAEAAGSALPFTVLRLGNIYGPYGPAFTVMPLTTMARGRIALVDGGAGNASATYVDDVVQAMLLAAPRDGTGQRYMIRGPDHVTWREFYAAYERMLGRDDRVVAMTDAEMDAASRGSLRRAVQTLVPEALAALKASPAVRRSAGQLPFVRRAYATFGKRLIRPAPAGAPPRATPGEDPVLVIPAMMRPAYANRSEFSIDKARRELGYAPAYDLARGMALTEAWARWANLVPH